mmetsp:Transcript_25878/g.40160  ORF Transcript_25878/g.40160 Transcript_25878/m.40160 type:complete len:182 (+) Transcript_25878:303-848(+)
MCDDSIQDALRSLQYEVANLRSRITCVEEENQNLRNQIHTMEKIVHEYNDDDCAPHRKRRNSSYGGMTRSSSGNKGGKISASYTETCNFCNPRRCRTCENRVATLPSIVSLLAENEYIDARQLVLLACIVNRFIYSFLWRVMLPFGVACFVRIGQVRLFCRKMFAVIFRIVHGIGVWRIPK